MFIRLHKRLKWSYFFTKTGRTRVYGTKIPLIQITKPDYRNRKTNSRTNQLMHKVIFEGFSVFWLVSVVDHDKICLWHMPATKTQISLSIHAVRSAPSLVSVKIVWNLHVQCAIYKISRLPFACIWEDSWSLLWLQISKYRSSHDIAQHEETLGP